MRDSQFRDVTFLDLIIKPEPEYAPRHNAQYFARKMRDLHAIDQTTLWNKAQTHKTFIRDIEIDEGRGYALLLLYHINGNAAAASYSHLDTHDQRDIPPEIREGRPESAHLLINLRSQGVGQFRHTAFLEESTKITRSDTQAFLNHLLREIKKTTPDDFTAPHLDGSMKRDGTPKTFKYTNRIELQGHPSTQFRAMLESGKLNGIALQTAQQEQLIVGDGVYVTPVVKEVRLRALAGKWHEQAWDRVTAAIKLGRDNSYELARITFQAADQKPHTARIDTQTGNVIGDSFIEKKRLGGFAALLKDADTAINAEIKGKMLEFIQ
jgi:hypothetical protein